MGKKVAAGMSDENPGRRLVFTREDIEKITRTLRAFLENAKARCVLLVDKDGHLLTKEGDSSTGLDTIRDLVAGSFAAVKQMAALLGEKGYAVTFHQDQRESIHLSLVRERTLLGVLFDDKTTLGMVRLYASAVSTKLGELFEEIAGRRPPDDLGRPGPTPGSP